MEISKTIQRPWGNHLGECWLLINYLINLAIETNEIIKLSTWYRKGWNHGNNKGKIIHLATKLTEILSLFQHDRMILLGKWPATIKQRLDPSLLWKYPHIQTKVVWAPNNSRKICYQFDAMSKFSARFPSIKKENKVLNYARKLNYNLVRLDKSKTLAECVSQAATSELFIGVDSGMLHLISSVGTPILLCENNRRIHKSHNQANKHFVLTKDCNELINAIKSYNENGIKYYLSNAKNINLFKGK